MAAVLVGCPTTPTEPEVVLPVEPKNPRAIESQFQALERAARQTEEAIAEATQRIEALDALLLARLALKTDVQTHQALLLDALTQRIPAVDQCKALGCVLPSDVSGDFSRLREMGQLGWRAGESQTRIDTQEARATVEATLMLVHPCQPARHHLKQTLPPACRETTTRPIRQCMTTRFERDGSGLTRQVSGLSPVPCGSTDPGNAQTNPDVNPDKR